MKKNNRIVRMKIAVRMLVHPKYVVGGAERQMELIGRELIKKDVDFHYITQKIYKNKKKFEIVNGIKVHHIGVYYLGTRFYTSRRKFHERIRDVFYTFDIILFFKYFRKLNFEIYHMRGLTDIIAFWSFFAKIIKRKKFVFTAAHINNCIPGSYSLSKLNYKLYEYGLKRADIVIVLAEYMKRALYQYYGINSVVIKSGHPIPKDPFKKEIPPTILWISRLVDWKRPELFLKIAEELKDTKAHFILIGNYYYKKKQIMAFADKYKNFTFIPGVPIGEDNKYYEKASLFINTSIYEGYPNSFIQAWMRETPVMSLDVDPDCDICRYGLGYHAKGDINAMVHKIKELIENPSKLKKMGKTCREYAINNHNIEKTAEQHFKLYNWILKKR